MNQIIERLKNRRKVLIWLIITFTAFTVLTALLIDDFIRDVILVPLVYYIWLAKIIINALPQNCLITLLVILSLVIAIPSLKKNRHTVGSPRMSAVNTPGEVAIWEQRLRYLRNGSYSSNRFAYHLGYLVIQILAYEERLTTREAIGALEAGEFCMPENVREYILSGIGSTATTHKRSPGHQVFTWLKRIFTLGQQPKFTKQHKEIGAVLQYIEQKLKIVETQNLDHNSISETTQPEVIDDK